MFYSLTLRDCLAHAACALNPLAARATSMVVSLLRETLCRFARATGIRIAQRLEAGVTVETDAGGSHGSIASERAQTTDGYRLGEDDVTFGRVYSADGASPSRVYAIREVEGPSTYSGVLHIHSSLVSRGGFPSITTAMPSFFGHSPPFLPLDHFEGGDDCDIYLYLEPSKLQSFNHSLFSCLKKNKI